MVAGCLLGRAFGFDNGGEDRIDAFDEGWVGKEVLEYEDPGAGEQNMVPFILEGVGGAGVGRRMGR